MGIEKGGDLPAPLDDANKFWAVADDEKLLRPKFDQSWTANSKWHTEFVKKFKKDGHSIDPFCPKTVFDTIESTALKKIAGSVTFKNLKLKYKEQE